MIRAGFLSLEVCADLIALARDGLAEQRLARRANYVPANLDVVASAASVARLSWLRSCRMIEDLVSGRSPETVGPSNFNFGDGLISNFFSCFVMVVFLIAKPLIGFPTTTSPHSAGCRQVSGQFRRAALALPATVLPFAAEVQSEVQLS